MITRLGAQFDSRADCAYERWWRFLSDLCCPWTGDYSRSLVGIERIAVGDSGDDGLLL